MVTIVLPAAAALAVVAAALAAAAAAHPLCATGLCALLVVLVVTAAPCAAAARSLALAALLAAQRCWCASALLAEVIVARPASLGDVSFWEPLLARVARVLVGRGVEVDEPMAVRALRLRRLLRWRPGRCCLRRGALWELLVAQHPHHVGDGVFVLLVQALLVTCGALPVLPLEDGKHALHEGAAASHAPCLGALIHCQSRRAHGRALFPPQPGRVTVKFSKAIANFSGSLNASESKTHDD